MKNIAYSFIGISMMGLTGCGSAPKSDPLAPRENTLQYVPPQKAMAGRLNNRPSAIQTDSASTSLWSSSPKSLFGDRRASQSGDILTVLIEVDDGAQMSNSVSSTRQNDEDLSLNAFFGLPQAINSVLPGGASLSPGVDIARGSSSSGDGSMSRGEQITLRLAAQVIEVMPNGYLKLAGQQQIVVNQEARLLQVTGIVRTQDISRLNTITYDKIADANIYYGGQGAISASTQRSKSSKILQKYVPF